MKNSDITVPMTNFIFSRETRVFSQIMNLHFSPYKAGMKPVAWIKSKLGRQNYMWSGEFRFHVWESGQWRVYVNNEKGICFEVLSGLNEQQAEIAWEEFLKQLSLM